MTQADLISLVRVLVPEINSTTVISDANLLIVLNMGATEFVKEAEAIPTSVTFNLVLDLVVYPLSTYATSFSKIRKEGLWIYNASTTKWSQLTPTTVPYLNKHYPTWPNTSSGLPMRYSIDGDELTINPKASATYAGTNYLKIYYYKKSTNMSASGHYPFSGSTTQYPHLADYEECLIDYVKYKLLPLFGKGAKGDEAKQMFYAKCKEAQSRLLARPDLVSEIKAMGAGNLEHHQGAFNA